MDKSTKKQVAIIGAGPSGLVQAKFLLDDGHDFVIFEQLDYLGGQWKFVEDDDPKVHSSCYRNMVAATVKETLEYTHFPMKKDLPKLVHWSHVLEYLHQYADHFGITKYIKYKHKVIHLSPINGGQEWKIIVDAEGTKREYIFDAVAIANGHHWDPYYPDIKGYERFQGKLIHSHSYRDAKFYAKKKSL